MLKNLNNFKDVPKFAKVCPADYDNDEYTEIVEIEIITSKGNPIKPKNPFDFRRFGTYKVLRNCPEDCRSERKFHKDFLVNIIGLAGKHYILFERFFEQKQPFKIFFLLLQLKIL